MTSSTDRRGMKKKKKLAIVLSIILTLFLIAIVALGTIASSEVYFLREGSGGTLFWRTDEAYLFMDGTRRGYRFGYLEYPWIALGEYLNAPPFPNDLRIADIVIRVTPSVVERHVVDFGQQHGRSPRSITPFDDGFYAQCPGVVLCKWTGTSFEPATQEEQRTHDGTKRLFDGDTSNGTINGWSVHHVGVSPGDHFEVQVGNNFAVAAKNHTINVREYSWVSVDLLRSGQPPERLYNVKGTGRRITKTEYESLFSKHQ